MNRMVVTDEATVARARTGDEAAFQTLVEQHSRSVFRLAYRMTGNEQDAEDVVQETFLRAYRQLDRFESRANFGTWIYRIAVNCSVDYMRSRGRHQDHRAADDAGPLLDSVAADGPAPDRLVLGAEIQDRIRDALDALSPMERAAFILRHFEDRSIEEIGRVLGLRANATKHSIFRAVRKMRTALQPIMSTK